jgi:HTH-type transcriptional regulator/antitoxin HipB
MATITSPQSLGKVLRASRKRLGLTQADLALAAGVGLRFIVELEAGKPTVRLEQVLRVVDALGGSLTLTGLDTEPAQADGDRHGA